MSLGKLHENRIHNQKDAEFDSVSSMGIRARDVHSLPSLMTQMRWLDRA
jgi:hypothetical protein